MTMDETGLTNLLLEPANRGHGQLASGAFRTTLPVAVHLVRLAESLGLPEDRIRMILKIGHWLLGSCLLLVVYLLLAKLGGFDPFSPGMVILAVTSLFTFPMTNITIKTFNYDLISSLGAVIALLLVSVAFASSQRMSVQAFSAAIVVATLAAQEKLSGSPILFIVLIAPAVFAATRWPMRPITAGVADTIAGILLSLSISVASTLLYVIGVPSVLWGGVWPGIVDAMSSWTWIPLLVLSGKGGGEIPSRVAAVTMAIGSLLGTTVLLGSWSQRLKAANLPLAVQHFPATVAGIMILGFGAGLVSAALLQPYWAPFYPTPISPSFAMNGVWLHFGFDSLAITRLAYLGYAFEILIVAIPTPLFIIMLLACILLLTGRRPCDATAGFLFVVALALILIGALLQVPLAHRYLNTPLFLILAASLLVILSSAQTYGLANRTRSVGLAAIAFMAALFLILETVPFRPLYAAFRPFWLNYPDADFAEAGRLNPSWMGWGEERALLGEKFEEFCGRSPDICRNGRIFHLYYGRWLPERPRSFEIFDAANVVGKEPLGDHDYYLFNRSRIVQGFPQPKSRPILTLDFRGYEMAWLYRGSDLAAENYGFGR
ncbi:hypothetical protein ACNJYA_13050 [Bradyrhizobium sp. DASA03068]|uniref:hypothetical protein n=1 Tax=Bradyrhizobium sp. BLXBL-01 TaxID=3395915 RepID=UPI003F6ED533